MLTLLRFRNGTKARELIFAVSPPRCLSRYAGNLSGHTFFSLDTL